MIVLQSLKIGFFTCVALLISSSFEAKAQNSSCDNKYQAICIEVIESRNQIDFYAINLINIPFTITLNVRNRNLILIAGGGQPRVIEGRSKIHLASYAPVPNTRWSYNYSSTLEYGNTNAVHDSSVLYQLPFAKDSEHEVMQGCHGSYTHFGNLTFAIDFAMPVGTPIHAARDGIVVGKKSDSNIGGPNRRYEDDTNYIMILHEDRTLGRYFHLMENGVLVGVGTVVTAGQKIGYSGNTGHSTGPHLHFDVITTESQKVAFETSQGIISCPQMGTILGH